MKNNLQNMMVVFALLLSGLLFAQTQTFNSNGTFTVPAGVTSIKIDAWGSGGGGGGGGGGNSGSGGDGGAFGGYTLTVTPGQTYNIAVGQGGSQNNDGTNSTISLGGIEILKANAGSKGILGVAGGNGGAASTVPSASGSNFVSYKGGNGAGGGNGSGDGGGGGGSAGNAGAGETGGIRGGGPGGPGGGAKGGNGGDRGFLLGNAITGDNGSSPGAGGGGRSSSITGIETATGGSGASGRVVISFSKADLQITKTVDKQQTLVNSTVIFTVVATNNGPSNVTGVKVQDKLPIGFTYVSHTVSAGVAADYVPATGLWSINTLNNGASRTLSVTATLNATGNNINTAKISADNNEDPRSINNSASASVSRALDTDGDGIPDYLDSDSDNDGILDCVEKGLTGEVGQYFKLNGNASQINATEFRLTAASNGQDGQAWSKGQVDFGKSFILRFQANLGNKSDGADGIAVVFQNSPQGTGASGAAGDGLGARGIKNGIVLELDTFYNENGPSGDPAGSNGHGMIWKSELQQNLTENVDLGNLKDGVWRNVVVTWDVNTKTLTYTVNGVMAGTYSNPTFYNDIFGSASATKAYFGFTASTGNKNNEQKIRFADPCNDLPLEKDTDGDGVPDHLDLDSDGDGCFDAIEGGGTIIVAQLNANGSISGGVNAAGIPTLAGAGQDSGVSTDVAKIECRDSDGDGIPDYNDLDKDNDGILDKAEGYCKFSSDIATDGFDTPVVPNLNANNVQSGSTFNGWTAINASTLANVPNAFNVIKVNGTTYTVGPNNAQSGNQYVDINGVDAIVYKQFTIATPTVVSASAYFANRDSGLAAYAPWSTKIEIVNTVTNVVVASGNNLAFTASLGDKEWFRSATPTIALPAGTYRVRMFVSNNGHLDSATYCFSTDSDGDGIPNYLDLDSDGDGCFDAVEGDENVLVSQLNANGSINIASNGGIDANGVPKLVNLTGSADVYGDQGQGAGNSGDALINGCKEICTEQVLGENFEQTGSATKTFTQPSTNYGFVFDIFKIDNSFNMTINGTALATAEVQFQSGTGLLKNIKFLDGSEYGVSSVPQVYDMTGTQAAPLLRVVISPSGSVRMYGSKSSGGALLPLTLYGGTTFNVANWNISGANTITIKQQVTGNTSIKGRGYGLNVIPCPKTPDAVNDTFETTNFGSTTASVLVNDTYTDGATVAATTTNVSLTQVGTWPAGITLNADGTITIAPNTALGTFALEYQICAVEAPANCDTAIATVNIYIDTDGDGVPDYLDLDSDNDGILDVEECGAIDRVLGSNFNDNGNNTNTSSIAGWNLSAGTLFSSQNNYVQFVSDTGVQSLSQAVSNISWNGEAPVVNMQFNARNTTSNISDSKVILTVAYEGTVYATLTTANNNDPATFVANNGATLVGTVPTYESDGAGSTFPGFVMQSLTLPNTVPTSGTFVIKFDPLAGGTGNASARDDININLFSIQTCVDTDGDGIPDYLDLDSDGDGCPDAIEGSGDFSSSDLIDSALIGGNTGDSYTGTSTNAVIQNLGNEVGDTETTLGIPTIAATGQTAGSSTNAAINACFCYLPGIIDEEAGNELDSRVGISALARAGVASTWPEIRKSGWIVLEAKTKGFVINRVTTTALDSITPVEGMMVFDTTANCLKVYTTIDGSNFAWYCMETQTCPE